MIDVCGVSVSDSRAALIAVGAVGCLLLLALARIGVWADQRYQRVKERPAIVRRAHNQPPVVEEEDADDA